MQIFASSDERRIFRLVKQHPELAGDGQLAGEVVLHELMGMLGYSSASAMDTASGTRKVLGSGQVQTSRVGFIGADKISPATKTRGRTASPAATTPVPTPKMMTRRKRKRKRRKT